MSLSGLDRVRGLIASVSTDQGFFMRHEITFVALFSSSPLTAPLQPFVGLDAGYTLANKAGESNKRLLAWALGCKYQAYGLHGDISYARSLREDKGYKLYMSLSLSLHQLISTRA